MARILRFRYLKPNDFSKALTIKAKREGARVRCFASLEMRNTRKGSSGSLSRLEPTSLSCMCMCLQHVVLPFWGELGEGVPIGFDQLLWAKIFI